MNIYQKFQTYSRLCIYYLLVSVSFLFKFSNPEIIKEEPLYAGRVIVLLGLSAMSLFLVSASC